MGKSLFKVPGVTGASAEFYENAGEAELRLNGVAVASSDETANNAILSASLATLGVAETLVASGAVASPNVCSNSVSAGGYNYIDPNTISVTVFGGQNGTGGGANANQFRNTVGSPIVAGIVTAAPGTGTSAQVITGVGAVNNTVGGAVTAPPTTDAYPGAARADYSQVFGYDLVANGQMTISMGSHNISYSSSDHPTLIGSNLFIYGGNANSVIGYNCSITGKDATGINGCVVLGYDNRIVDATGAANNASILGGTLNSILSPGTQNHIVGGVANLISSSGASGRNSILGGYLNAISGATIYGCIAGGTGNTIIAGGYSLVNGINNAVAGTYAMAFGNNNTVSGQASVGLGSYTSVASHGVFAYGSQASGTAGNSEFRVMPMQTSAATTNATPATMTTQGTNLAIASNKVWVGDVMVAARDSSGNAGGWSIPCVVENIAGTVTVRKGISGEATTLYDGITVAATPFISASGSNVTVTVTGKAATTITWSAHFRIQQGG